MMFIISRAHRIAQHSPGSARLAGDAALAGAYVCVECKKSWREFKDAGRCRRKVEALSSGWSGPVVDVGGKIIGRAGRAGPQRIYRIKLNIEPPKGAK